MNTREQRTRVLLVDDHPIVRMGLSAIIADTPDMHLMGEVATAAETLTFFENAIPDVALIDLSLPDMDGIDLIYALRRTYAGAYYLVLTTRTGAGDINRALQAGAHAYLFKDSSREELVSAIRTVALGGRYIPPSVGKRAEELPRGLDLTSREMDVLRWLGKGLSNEEIAKQLCMANQTVKSHLKNLSTKLGRKSRTEIVVLCLRLGIIHADEL